MSYRAPSTSSEATSAVSSGQALPITWEGNQFFNQSTAKTHISDLINLCADAMGMENPPYYPYHAHLMSGLHGSHSDSRHYYTFKIWAHQYVTRYDVNPQGHTATETFLFSYHYYEDGKYQRWLRPMEAVPSSANTHGLGTQAQATASEWVWDAVHKRHRKLVNGAWQWALPA